MSDSVLNKISRFVGGLGPTIARLLNIEEATIDSLRSSYSNSEECAFQLMRAWKSLRGPASASFSELRQALVYSTCSKKAIEGKSRYPNHIYLLSIVFCAVLDEFSGDGSEEENFISLQGFQPLKGLISTNVKAGLSIGTLSRVLKMSEETVPSVVANFPHDLIEQAAFIITQWERKLSEDVQIQKEEKIRRLFASHGLGDYLSSCDCHTSSEALLERYLEYVTDQNMYVDTLGAGSEGRQRLELKKVYVSLKFDKKKVSSYQRDHLKKGIDAEMKAYLKREEDIDLNDLSEENYVSTVQKYLSDLPAGLNPFLQPGIQRRDPSPDDTPVARAFQENPALVILGDPGSGKTTIVRWFALRLAQAYTRLLTSNSATVSNEDINAKDVHVPYSEVYIIDENRDRPSPDFNLGPVRLPVFVQAARFADFLSDPENSVIAESNHALVDFIGSRNHCLDHWKGNEIFGDQLNKIIKDEMKVGGIVVLLDGLDEVKDSRARVVRAVEHFLEERVYHQQSKRMRNQLIVTSRIAGFTAFSTKGTITYGNVQRMNRLAIWQFCKNWMEASYLHDCPLSETSQRQAEAKKMAAEMHRSLSSSSHPGLYDLASNPLLLTVLATLYKQTKKLPEKRAELYDAVVDFLINSWQDRKRGAFSSDEKDRLIKSFIHLAYDLHNSSKAGHIRESELINRFGHRYLLPIESGDALSSGGRRSERRLVGMFESSGLLNEKANKTYGFIHLSFQEFFAGRKLVDDEAALDVVTNNVVEHIYRGDSRWKEPVLLALGYVCLKRSNEQLNLMLKRIIERSDSDPLVPVSSLFLVHALPEFKEDSLKEDVAEVWVTQLVRFYIRNLLKPAGESVCRQIESALRKMIHVRGGQVFQSNLRTVLNMRIKDTQSSLNCYGAALLLERLGSPELVDSNVFLSTLHRDSKILCWPIHGLLRRLSSPDPLAASQVNTDPTISSFDELDKIWDPIPDESNSAKEATSKELESLNVTFWNSIQKELPVNKGAIMIYADEDITEEMSFRFSWATSLVSGNIASASLFYRSVSSLQILDQSKFQKLCATLSAFTTCFRAIPLCKMFGITSVLEDLIGDEYLPENVGLKNLHLLIRSNLIRLWQILSWNSLVIFILDFPLRKRLKEILDLLSEVSLDQARELLKEWTVCTVSVGLRLAHQLHEQFRSRESIRNQAESLCNHLTASLAKFASTRYLSLSDVNEAKEKTLTWLDNDTVKEPLAATASLLEYMNKCQTSIDCILSFSVQLQRSERKFQERMNEMRRQRLNSLVSKRKLGCLPELPRSRVKEFLRRDGGKVLSSLKQSSDLIRLFVALYGGIALFDYPEAVHSELTLRTQEKLSDLERKHLEDLQWLFPYEVSHSVAQQLREDVFNKANLFLPLKRYKEIKPSISLSYMYRGASAVDSVYLDLLKSVQSDCRSLDLAVQRVQDLLLRARGDDLLEVHDAALFICAVGRTGQLFHLPLSKSVGSVVDSALAEALSSLKDPACRSWIQLMRADVLGRYLDTSEGVGVLRQLFLAFLEFGGAPGINLFLELRRSAKNESVRLYLAAEILACVLLEMEKKSNEALSFEDFLKILPFSSSANLASVFLCLPQTCTVLSWEKTNSIVLPQLCSLCQNSRTFAVTLPLKDVYSLDLLNILKGISSTCLGVVSRTTLLSRLQPETDSPEILTLWKTFEFCLHAKDIRFPNWMQLRVTRDDLERVVERALEDSASIEDSASTSFAWAQAMIVLAEFSPDRRKELLQSVTAVAKRLGNKLEAFQLIWWTLPLVSLSNRGEYVSVGKTIALSDQSSPLSSGRCLVRLAFKADQLTRKWLVMKSFEYIRQCVYTRDRDHLISMLKELRMLVSSFYSSDQETKAAYDEMTRFLPEDVCEACEELLQPIGAKVLQLVSSGEEEYEFASTLDLAFRLRDVLVLKNACSELKSERHLWKALVSGNFLNDEGAENVAFRRLKNLIKCGTLDLTVESALCLESLLCGNSEEVKTKANEIVPYLRPSSLDAVDIVVMWLLEDFKQEFKFAAALCSAEVYGIRLSTVDLVAVSFNHETDIFRFRAQEVVLGGARPYYTSFEDCQFLRRLSRLTGISIYRWIWHNSVAFFKESLSLTANLDELVKNQAHLMIANMAAADCKVGNAVVDCFDQELSSDVYASLLSSICNLCYLDGKVNKSAADGFYERILRDLRSLDRVLSFKFYSSDASSLLQDALHCLHSVQVKSGSMDLSETCRRKIVRRYAEVRQKCFPNLGRSLLNVQEPADVKHFFAQIGKLKFSSDLDGDAIKEAESCDPKVLDVLSEWTSSAMAELDELDACKLLGSPLAIVEDLIICLGAVGKRSPSGLRNIAKNQENQGQIDLRRRLNTVAQDHSYRRSARESALAALASLTHLTTRTAESFLLLARQSVPTASAAFSEVRSILYADDDALLFVGERLKSKSCLEALMSARLLSSLASHNQLSSRQRSSIFLYFQSATSLPSCDQPLCPMWLCGKTYKLRSLLTVLLETLANISKTALQEPSAVPHQLGEPDSEGVYANVASSSATTIWFKYRPSRDCWYWTPYQTFRCWMPVSTNFVQEGPWKDQVPASENQDLIRFLNQVNPIPPAVIEGFDDEGVFNSSK